MTAVHSDRVELSDGRTLASRTVVWGGGESAAAIAGDAGPTPGCGGRLGVRHDLGVDGYPHTYAGGDIANIPSDDGALPQLGSVAEQSGRWAAHNILRELPDQPTEPFVYADRGIMAMIGRDAAVAEIGARRHQIEGPIAFAAWLGVHAVLLRGVHRKVDALLTWGWDYIERDHQAVAESLSSLQRIVWGDDDGDVPHVYSDPST